MPCLCAELRRLLVVVSLISVELCPVGAVAIVVTLEQEDSIPEGSTASNSFPSAFLEMASRNFLNMVPTEGSLTCEWATVILLVFAIPESASVVGFVVSK